MTEQQSPSMVDTLRSDHRAIQALLDDADAATDTDDGAVAREQLVINLVRHFVAEEQYLYPTVREHVEGGAALADAGFTADRTAERQLKQLESTDLSPAQLAAVWSDVQAAFAAHTALQEPLLTGLATAVPADELARLGDDVLGAEQLAPTRPRMIAPESAAANKVASFVEGWIDHVRDTYSKRGVDPHAE